MQTFKEIPFQNYIQLKFNSKNFNELSQQQALIKYKRNAQLLAQIFTFQHKKREIFKTQDCLSQSQVDELRKQIEHEQQVNQQNIEKVKQTSRRYEEIANGIKQIKSKEQLFNIIDTLKSNDLYDDSHPYFVENSPFYLSTTDQEYLQVTKYQPMSEEGLSFLQIN